MKILNKILPPSNNNKWWKAYDGWRHTLILSDIHSGSIYAPWPEELDSIDGIRNKVDKERQKFLNNKWREMEAWLPPRLDAVICNGDTLHGEEAKEGGKFCMTQQIKEQADGARILLQGIRDRTSRMYLITGTPYHEKDGGELEFLGEVLGCERWNGDKFSGQVLQRNWQGIEINVSHHNTGYGMLASGSADRLAMIAAATETIVKTTPADVIIRGHMHMKRIVQVFNKWVVFCPAWQLITPRVIKIREYYKASLFSDLGCIVMSIPNGEPSVYDIKFTCFDFKLPNRTRSESL